MLTAMSSTQAKPMTPPRAARLHRRAPAPQQPRRPSAHLASDRFGRNLAYLTAGLGTSILAWLVWSVGLTLSIGLAPVGIGAVALVGTAGALRWVAEMDRRRTGRVLGRALEGRHPDHDPIGLRARVRGVVGDGQSRRDLKWAVVHSVVGFTFGVAALSLVVSVLGMVTLPLWYWAPPNTDFIGLWHSNTLPKALAVVPLAIPAFYATVKLVAVMAAAEVRLAVALLER